METYLSIYANSSLATEDLTDIISKYLNVLPDKFGNIESESHSLNVKPNGYFDLEEHKANPSDFLYFPYVIEFEWIATEFRADEFVTSVSDFLVFLWNQKIPAVAACRFEELLPENGKKVFEIFE